MFFFKRKKKDISQDNSLENEKEEFNDIVMIFQYIENRAGINLFDKEKLIKDKLMTFSRSKDIYSFKKLLKEIKISEKSWHDLMDLLTTNETYFFREIKQIQDAITSLKIKKPPYNILCIPSSTGEEVYTILILLLESGLKLEDVSILGVDISQETIAKANQALYKKRSIHKVPDNILEKYFRVLTNEIFTLQENIKRKPIFEQCNIFDKKVFTFGRFDIIFSRNMFIYFDDIKKIQAYDILKQLQKDSNAHIYLGHADVSSKLSQYIKLTQGCVV